MTLPLFILSHLKLECNVFGLHVCGPCCFLNFICISWWLLAGMLFIILSSIPWTPLYLSSPLSHTLMLWSSSLGRSPQTLLHDWKLGRFSVSYFAAMLSTVLSFPFIAWIFLSDGKSLRTDTGSSNLSCSLPSSLVNSGFLWLLILLFMYHQCRVLDWLRKAPLPPHHGGGSWER